MIRFCDGMTCNVNIQEYSAENLLLSIIQNGMQNYIFQLYNGEEYLGYATYYDLLLHKDQIEKSIRTEHILFDEKVFENCNAYFKKNIMSSFVPVFDGDDIIYIAYSDTTNPVSDYQITNFAKNLSISGGVDIRDIYSGIEMIKFYDCNEISYYLYLYAKKNDIPYKIYGEKWKLIGSEYLKEIKSDIDAPDYATMNIVGEAYKPFTEVLSGDNFYKKPPVIDNYLFLYKMVNYLYNLSIYVVSEQLKKKNTDLCLVNIPDVVDDMTADEIYRKNNQINLNQIDLLDTPEKIQSLYSVYGKELVEQYKSRETFKDRVTGYFQGISSFSMLDENRKKQIYLLGPCITYQSDLMAKDTIVNQIQNMSDGLYPGEYKVTAISIPIESFNMFERVINSMKINSGDIFLFMYINLDDCGKYEYLDLTNIYNTRNGQNWFSNSPIHVNVTGSHAVAKYIFDEYIVKKLNDSKEQNVLFYPTMIDPSEKIGLENYFHQYAHLVKKGNNGAIVMNCNPYTFGHDYLIQMASKKVDNLYIFVVEEDKSFFSFEDRFNLVKENTKKYPNVIVLPSGRMILSSNTFGAYFQKEQYHEIECDATDDMKLFGLAVAPFFGIKTRFSGTEPKDIVTNSYLKSMMAQLPVYGIKVEVIERKKDKDDVISATNVRALLRKKDWERIRKLVPDVTYRFLYNKFNA